MDRNEVLKAIETANDRRALYDVESVVKRGHADTVYMSLPAHVTTRGAFRRLVSAPGGRVQPTKTAGSTV